MGRTERDLRKNRGGLYPKEARKMVAHEAVEHAPGFLRVHKILIDGARMFERGLHGALGNFVEGDTLNARRSLWLHPSSPS